MSGWVSSTGWNINLASPGPIGNVTPSSGSFTTLAASSNVTLSGGTANGVVYLNGSKVATSGSALTFDGTALLVGATGYPFIHPTGYYVDGGYAAYISGTSRNGFSDMVFTVRSSESMRLTSTGLQITNVVSTGGYTVATLPVAAATGSRAYVTDALTPVNLSIVTGGGAVVVPVFYNGTNWIVG